MFHSWSDFGCSLYEHQSTFNPNLSAEISVLYFGLILGYDRQKQIIRFTKNFDSAGIRHLYNGIQDQPDRRILRLSDLYSIRDQHCKLELEAVMLNINLGHNPALMNACTMLHQYAEYTDRVRRYTKTMSLEDAVEHAITECIHEGILKSFLEKNRAEVKNVCIYEYDEEEHIRLERSYAGKTEKRKDLKKVFGRAKKGKLAISFRKNSRKEKLFPRLQTSLKIRKKISDAWSNSFILEYPNNRSDLYREKQL